MSLEIINSWRGIIAAFLSLFSFTTCDLLIYSSGQTVHPINIVVWNGVVTIILSVICIAFTRPAISQISQRATFLFLILTALLEGSGNAAMTSANILATPGTAIAILSTKSIFTIIFGVIFLGEKCRSVDAILTIFSITGVLFISRPTFLSKIIDGSSPANYSNVTIFHFSDEYEYSDGSAYSFGVMLALISASFVGTAMVGGSHLGNCEVSPFYILLPIGFTETLTGAVLCFIFDLWIVPGNILSALKLIGVGVTEFGGMLAMFYAVAKERPTTVSIIMTFELVILYIAQYFLFGLPPQWTDALGVIFLSVTSVCASLTASNGVIRNTSPEDVIQLSRSADPEEADTLLKEE